MKERRERLRKELSEFVNNHPFSIRRLSTMVGLSRPTLQIFLNKGDNRTSITTLYLVESFLKNHIHGESGDEYQLCNYLRDYDKGSDI